MKPTRFCLLLVGQEKEIITKICTVLKKNFSKNFFFFDVGHFLKDSFIF